MIERVAEQSACVMRGCMYIAYIHTVKCTQTPMLFVYTCKLIQGSSNSHIQHTHIIQTFQQVIFVVL